MSGIGHQLNITFETATSILVYNILLKVQTIICDNDSLFAIHFEIIQ